MFLKRNNLIFYLLLLITIFTNPTYSKKASVVDLAIDFANNDLQNGAVVYEKNPLIIVGHSGWGPSAVFNDLLKLSLNDIISVNGVYYVIFNISAFDKGTSLNLKKQKNCVYLITCDMQNFDKQWVFYAKKV